MSPYPRSNQYMISGFQSEVSMSLISELKSWLWILKIWVPLYSVLLLLGTIVGTYLGSIYYWSAIIIGVPLVIIPMTYKNLVGGGCSIRFQICALVKGMLAGFIFLTLSILADLIIWQILGTQIGWTPFAFGVSRDIQLIWFLSGLIGGFGARIIEVRGQTQHGKITVAGFE